MHSWNNTKIRVDNNNLGRKGGEGKGEKEGEGEGIERQETGRKGDKGRRQGEKKAGSERGRDWREKERERRIRERGGTWYSGIHNFMQVLVGFSVLFTVSLCIATSIVYASIQCSLQTLSHVNVLSNSLVKYRVRQPSVTGFKSRD